MTLGFERYIGIDYSGAETPTKSLAGLRVYEADRLSVAQEIEPPPSPRKYWTRKGIAQWLVATLAKDDGALVGIDHGFSFPLRYFEQHGLPLDWDAFLDDFQRHWPTDQDHTYVDFVRGGSCGNAEARWGDPHWRRITEVRARAKSVFPFRCSGTGRQIHPCRYSVVALHPAATRQSSSLLAFRWVECGAPFFGHRRSLPCAMEQELSGCRPQSPSARRFCNS